MPPIKVLITNDHLIFQCALAALLEECVGITIVGGASDRETALQMAGTLQPDVVLVDLDSLRWDGLAAVRELLSACPAQGIITLAGDSSDVRAFEAVRSGAQGYVPKQARGSDLVAAVQAVARGEVSIDEDLVPQLAQQYNAMRQGRPRANPDALTGQELAILRLMVAGKGRRAIAAELALTVYTVEGGIDTICCKLGVSNRMQAVAAAITCGLAGVEPVN